MNTDEEPISDALAPFSTDNLIEEITRRICGETTVRLEIAISSEGYSIGETKRSPKSLRLDGISMRNVFGEFIKEETP